MALQHLEARLFIVAGVVICGILAGFTRYSATIWQDYPGMVVAAAKKAPDSARAQSQFALKLYNEGRYEEAIAVLDATRQRIPDDLAVDVIRTTVLCNSGALTAGQFATFSGRMAERLFDPRTVNTLTTMMEGILSQRCPAVSAADTADMFRAMAELPGNTDPQTARYSQLQYFIGLSALNAGEPKQAIEAFDRSLQSRPGAGHAMLMAAQLATHGHFDDALHFSDLALRQFDRVAGSFLPAERVRREDIIAFQEQVRMDRDAAPGTSGIDPGH